MDVEMCFDSDARIFLIYRGAELVLATKSYNRALKRFNELCDQFRGEFK